jgi:phosphatidylserine decarboxylase
MVRAALFTLAAAMLAAIGLTALKPLAHFTAVSGVLAMWWVTLILELVALLVLFFRDPERVPPADDRAIVSPADGHVVYVRPVPPREVPVAQKQGRSCSLPELSGTLIGDGGAVSVGISMNLSDVHVNRAPVTGRVTLATHVHGTFGSLRKPEMLLTNERATTVIDSGDLQIAMVQIASRLVRRIVGFVTVDEMVQLGQRVGMIRFGSQVDLLIPDRTDIRLTIQPGDRVTAGRTVIALVTSTHDHRQLGLPARPADARAGDSAGGLVGST